MEKLELIALLTGALTEITEAHDSLPPNCTFGPDPDIKAKLEAALVTLGASV